MSLLVLGPLDTGSDPLSPRERVILAALIVRRGKGVSPAELADALWADQPPATWEQQVRNSVARIRSRLGRDAVTTAGWGYRLGLDPESIDAVRFERFISTARQHALHGEHDRSVDGYRKALALWRGEPLPEVASWEPGTAEAARLAELHTTAQEELLDARLRAGEDRTVIPDAEQLLRENALREDRWAILALANYRANRQADALSVLRAARTRLDEELGVEPGVRLTELETAILRHDPALDAPPPMPRENITCPYPGLVPFGPDDAESFFGRDADIEAVCARVRPGTITVIAGPSGCGKSSLMLAGVIPELRRRGRSVEVMRPASGGVPALARLLRPDAALEVFAIDQAEELISAPAADAEAFSRQLADLLTRDGSLVLTVRSDFLDRLGALPRIGPSLGRGVYLLTGLDAVGLRSAIEGPAHLAGLRLEPGLVELVLRDAVGRPAVLPHLSHALVETWVRREGMTLTVEGYEAAGGIAGAIARSAESAYQAMSPDEQAACRSIMRRLIERDPSGASTRRRPTAAPILHDPVRHRVVDLLVSARLVTRDGDALIVGHEAVAEAWPRLDGWLQEDADGARLLGTVATGAEVWEAGGRKPDDLLRGGRLQAALDWRTASAPDLTPVEAAFLDASAKAHQSELEAQRRQNRRLRWALSGAGVLLVAALVTGGFAVVQRQEATTAAENATIEATVATSLALRANDRDAAALLAAEAYRRWPEDGRVRSALLGSITAAAGLLDTHHTTGAKAASMVMIPGTGTALRVRDGDAGTALEVVDVVTGAVVRTLDVDLDFAHRWMSNGRDISISRDGRVALVQTGILADPADAHSCCLNQLTFIDIATGNVRPGSQLLRTRTSTSVDLGVDGSVAYIEHPITGDLIAVDTRRGDVRASSPEAFDDYSGQSTDYNAIAVIDEDHVATAVSDRIYIYNRSTLSLERSIPLSLKGAGRGLVADASGRLLSSGRDGLVLVDPTRGAVEWMRAQRPAEVCQYLEPTGRATVVCSSIGEVSVLDARTGQPTGPVLRTQIDDAMPVSVIDDQTVLISAKEGALWMRWRLDGSGAGTTPIARGQHIVDSPSTDGRFIATLPIAGGPMQLWDVGKDTPAGLAAEGITLLSDDVVESFEDNGYSLENIKTHEKYPYDIRGLPHDFWLFSGGWGPDAFVGFEDKVIAFDPETGEQVGQPLILDSVADTFGSISESLDGAFAAVNWWDSTQGESRSTVFRIADGEELADGLPGRDRTLMSQSGQVLAVADETVERVDLATLEPTSTLARADGGSQLLTESLDGRTLLNVGYNNRLTLYDLTLDIPLGDSIDADVDSGITGGYLTADGLTLLTNTEEGVLSWDLRPAAQASAACALAGRELSAVEWASYFPGEAQVPTCRLLAD